jgi:hypothetical protein
MFQRDLEAMPPIPVDELVRRAWAEYREMPGLTLTVSQARRLWNLDERLSRGILDTLVSLQLLRVTSRGTYVLRDPV